MKKRKKKLLDQQLQIHSCIESYETENSETGTGDKHISFSSNNRDDLNYENLNSPAHANFPTYRRESGENVGNMMGSNESLNLNDNSTYTHAPEPAQKADDLNTVSSPQLVCHKNSPLGDTADINKATQIHSEDDKESTPTFSSDESGKVTKSRSLDEPFSSSSPDIVSNKEITVPPMRSSTVDWGK